MPIVYAGIKCTNNAEKNYVQLVNVSFYCYRMICEGLELLSQHLSFLR